MTRISSPRTRLAGAAALLALLLGASCPAGLLDEPLPSAPPAAEAPSAPREPAPPAAPAPPGGLRRENVLLIDGKPQALYWAEGLANAGELPQYSALGFNALRIPVTSAGEEALTRAERLAEAAEKAGLFVLADLCPEPAVFRSEDGPVPQSPLSGSYRLVVREFVDAVVPRLQTRKGLAAWVVSAVDAESVTYSQSDFWAYLQKWHGTLPQINAAWGSDFPTALGITDAAIRVLDAARPGGIGVASLDLARYRQQAYADLLGVWADEIHAFDRSHAVLAGRIFSYRSAVSVPEEEFEGSVCGFFPGICEPDVLTHNAQGIDIARRGNRLAALPVLATDLRAPPSRVSAWIAEAVVHGAAGVGFSSWQAIRADPALQRAIAEAVRVTRDLKLCPVTPRARIAVLYQPFAAGARQSGMPLYGYLRGLSDTEPGRLFAALSRGTRFGPVDYIAEQDLPALSPQTHAVLLAPLALYLPESGQRALERYVQAGGALVADLGVGMYQSGDMTVPPPILVRLFGIKMLLRVEKEGPVWNVLHEEKRFPSLRVADSPSETQWKTPFAGLTSYVTLAPDAVPLLTSYPLARKYGGYCGLLLHPVGKGHALYATSRLWEEWVPGRRLFDEVFGDLIGPGSEVAVAEPAGLASPCEVVPCGDGLLLINNTGADAARVLVADPERRVYQMPGGVQCLRPKEVSANSLLTVPAGSLVPARPLPLTVTPREVPVFVQVARYQPDEIVLVLHPGLSQIQPDAQGRLAVIPQGLVEVEVAVKDGVYPVAPGSAHLVSGKPLAGGKPWENVFKAGADGVLSFPCASAGSVVTIKPAQAVPRAP